MPSDTALYIGPAANLIDGTALIPGVTVANVHAAEALLSDLWEPLTPAPNPATSSPLNQWDGGTLITQALGTLDGGTP